MTPQWLMSAGLRQRRPDLQRVSMSAPTAGMAAASGSASAQNTRGDGGSPVSAAFADTSITQAEGGELTASSFSCRGTCAEVLDGSSTSQGVMRGSAEAAELPVLVPEESEATTQPLSAQPWLAWASSGLTLAS